MMRGLLLVVALAACGGPATSGAVQLHGATMGTTWNAVVVDAPADSEPARLIQHALDEVDQRMSTWKSDSELSRFAAAPAGPWTGFSASTLEVLDIALEISRLSNGAFDPTVGPLVRLWGFGADEIEHPPTSEQIAATRARVGTRLLERRADGSVVRARPDVELDFSAIAKGYGVDRAAEALRAAGCKRFLVEVGGEVRVSGDSPKGSPWRIGIDRPIAGNAPGASLHGILQLRQGAVATSGDYRNFREVDGQRFSHTIDPRSGRPVEHPLASVTVIAADCMHADALATAVMVLGPESGLALIESLDGVEATLLSHEDAGGLAEVSSSGWQSYLAQTSKPESRSESAREG